MEPRQGEPTRTNMDQQGPLGASRGRLSPNGVYYWGGAALEHQKMAWQTKSGSHKSFGAFNM